MTNTTKLTPSAESFSEQVFESALGPIEILSMYFGIELGFYEALAEQGSVTPDQLAESCETNERYTREWCEQEAAYGLIRFESRVFSLDPGHAEVLTDVHSEFFLAPLARMIGSSAARLDELKAAYRSGGGVSWEAFGPSMRESQSDMNRPFFEHGLAAGLAEVDSLHEILSRPNARIADVGSGGGWSAIALAKAYPTATVVGYDIDCPSIEMAEAHAASEGLSERIAFSRSTVDSFVSTNSLANTGQDRTGLMGSATNLRSRYDEELNA